MDKQNGETPVLMVNTSLISFYYHKSITVCVFTGVSRTRNKKTSHCVLRGSRLCHFILETVRRYVILSKYGSLIQTVGEWVNRETETDGLFGTKPLCLLLH